MFFTDYCRFSADLSAAAIKQSGFYKVERDISITINPFRSPFREDGNGVNFALFSNAFVFQLPL